MTIYLCIIIFLFVLAIFDLIVGVSNDAVNFLNSAVGAKAASFKTILFIAGIGIFIGASLSNGMMDIARHGIYQPEHFYFAEIMCILLAVMLTDVVLLDVFNSMGMPTSTTVSLVFELLGGTFALSLIKVHNSDTLGLGDLINTDKALSVIMAIFVSVAIAFFFGMIVQWLARVIFTFNYTKKMKYSIALFGGVAATAIIYFMLIKGLKRQLLHDPRKQTLDTRQHIDVNRRLLRVLHRTDANPSLDENQRFQSHCIDGHLRPRSRFCRQRPCQLHRCAVDGLRVVALITVPTVPATVRVMMDSLTAGFDPIYFSSPPAW